MRAHECRATLGDQPILLHRHLFLHLAPHLLVIHRHRNNVILLPLSNPRSGGHSRDFHSGEHADSGISRHRRSGIQGRKQVNDSDDRDVGRRHDRPEWRRDHSLNAPRTSRMKGALGQEPAWALRRPQNPRPAPTEITARVTFCRGNVLAISQRWTGDIRAQEQIQAIAFAWSPAEASIAINPLQDHLHRLLGHHPQAHLEARHLQAHHPRPTPRPTSSPSSSPCAQLSGSAANAAPGPGSSFPQGAKGESTEHCAV